MHVVVRLLAMGSWCCVCYSRLRLNCLLAMSAALGGALAATNCTEGPSTTEPVNAFDCPNGLAKDSVCTATCSAGYTGTVQATCGAGRQFVNTGTCTPLGKPAHVV
jgi:hypothetical protein